MTQSKQYNLKLFCQIKNIEIDTDEAQEFLKKKFYEQLIILKELKDSISNTEDVSEGEESYSIIESIRNRYV